jgi:hypothetical protein
MRRNDRAGARLPRAIVEERTEVLADEPARRSKASLA